MLPSLDHPYTEPSASYSLPLSLEKRCKNVKIDIFAQELKYIFFKNDHHTVLRHVVSSKIKTSIKKKKRGYYIFKPFSYLTNMFSEKKIKKKYFLNLMVNPQTNHLTEFKFYSDAFLQSHY